MLETILQIENARELLRRIGWEVIYEDATGEIWCTENEEEQGSSLEVLVNLKNGALSVYVPRAQDWPSLYHMKDFHLEREHDDSNDDYCWATISIDSLADYLWAMLLGREHSRKLFARLSGPVNAYGESLAGLDAVIRQTQKETQ